MRSALAPHYLNSGFSIPQKCEGMRVSPYVSVPRQLIYAMSSLCPASFLFCSVLGSRLYKPYR